VVHSKGDRDSVTELDLEIQETMQRLLRARAPQIGFRGEESITQSSGHGHAERTWVLDPIDGTSNCPAIRRVASKRQALFVDAATVACPGDDGTHLSRDSHERLATLIAQKIDAAGLTNMPDPYRPDGYTP
jgi:hypothetical protein